MKLLPLFSVEDSLDADVLYLAFSLPFDELSEEYMIYNFGRIAAATGGAAGLFLGVSLFQIISWIIDFAMDRVEGDEEIIGNGWVNEKKLPSQTSSTNSSASRIVKVKPVM